MKKNLFYTFLTIAILFFTSCEDEKSGETTPEFAVPSISITDPEIPTAGLEAETGVTITFTINVAAEAGLSSVTVGETNIKTFAGTELSEVVTYDYIPMEEGTVILTFAVEDAMGEKATVDALINVAKGIDLGYLLLDFAGESTSSELVTIVDWDVRTKSVFSVTGSHGATATAEVVNSQAQLFFAQENPDATDLNKVFKYEQTIADTAFDSWGGWAHLIFGLGTAVPEENITTLPTWDNDNTVTVAGTKVVKVDVYYDATVDASFTWDSLIAKTDVWGSDPSMGYSIHLSLAKYDPFAVAEGMYDDAFYMGYMSYVSEPNKWVTVTFDQVDVARTHLITGAKENAPLASEIDCIRLLPAGGYNAVNANPLYFKNLRIVDVDVE